MKKKITPRHREIYRNKTFSKFREWMIKRGYWNYEMAKQQQEAYAKIYAEKTFGKETGVDNYSL